VAGKVQKSRRKATSKRRKRHVTTSFPNNGIHGHKFRVANDLVGIHLEATADAVQGVIDLFRQTTNMYATKTVKPEAGDSEVLGKVSHQFRNLVF
jgi:hypothetical protein